MSMGQGSLARLRSARSTALGILGIIGTGIAYNLNYRLINDEGTTAPPEPPG